MFFKKKALEKLKEKQKLLPILSKSIMKKQKAIPRNYYSPKASLYMQSMHKIRNKLKKSIGKKNFGYKKYTHKTTLAQNKYEYYTMIINNIVYLLSVEGYDATKQIIDIDNKKQEYIIEETKLYL